MKIEWKPNIKWAKEEYEKAGAHWKEVYKDHQSEWPKLIMTHAEQELEKEIEDAVIDFVKRLAEIVARRSGSVTECPLGKVSALAMHAGRHVKRCCGYPS